MVPTALYGTKSREMRSAERRKVSENFGRSVIELIELGMKRCVE